MIQHFSRNWEQPVLEQGLHPISMSFILTLGHLRGFLLPDYLLPQSQVLNLEIEVVGLEEKVLSI